MLSVNLTLSHLDIKHCSVYWWDTNGTYYTKNYLELVLFMFCQFCLKKFSDEFSSDEIFKQDFFNKNFSPTDGNFLHIKFCQSRKRVEKRPSIQFGQNYAMDLTYILYTVWELCSTLCNLVRSRVQRHV